MAAAARGERFLEKQAERTRVLPGDIRREKKNQGEKEREREKEPGRKRTRERERTKERVRVFQREGVFESLRSKLEERGFSGGLCKSY